MKSITFSFVLLTLVSYAQEKTMTFEISANKINYKLESLNPYFNDTLFYRTFFYPNGFSPKFKNGNDLGLSLGFGLNRFLSIELNGNYQYSKYESAVKWQSDAFPYPNQQFIRKDKVEISAFLLGAGSRININEFWSGKTDSKVLKRVEMFLGINSGIGFINFKNFGGFDELPIPLPFQVISDQRNAYSFQGSIQIDIGYQFLKRNVFSSVGFNLGYQYFRTEKLKSPLRGNNIISNSQPIGLDLSGFFYGVYLKLGK